MKPLPAAGLQRLSRGTSEGVLDGDLVRFRDLGTFERAAQLIVERGLIHVTTTGPATARQTFSFEVEFPDHSRFLFVGSIKKLRGRHAIIRLEQGGDEFMRVWGPSAEVRLVDRQRRNRRGENIRVRLVHEECLTCNVSEAGMCIATNQRPAVGAILDGAVKVGAEWVSFQGEVRWCRLKNDRERHGRVGVRLLEIGEAYKKLFRPTPLATLRALQPRSPLPSLSTAPRARRSASRPHEPRKSRRISCRVGVSLEGLIGLAVDVSEEGIAVETERVLVPGSRVNGVLHLTSGKARFAGQVRWARSGAELEGTPARMGILVDTGREALLRYLRSFGA